MLGVITYAAILPTGEIVQTGTAPDWNAFNMISIPGATLQVAPDWVDDDKHYWTGTAFAELPPKPGTWAVWDGSVWFDPRNVTDLNEELERARHASRLTRIAFSERAMELGILDPTGAKQAARGIIPDSYLPLLEQLSAYELDSIEIRWAGASEISRMDPFILKVAELAGFPDTLVDELFGVETP